MSPDQDQRHCQDGGDERDGLGRQIAPEWQQEGEQGLEQLRKDRNPEVRQERQGARRRERTGIGKVVEGRVERGRRVQGQDRGRQQDCHPRGQPEKQRPPPHGSFAAVLRPAVEAPRAAAEPARPAHSSHPAHPSQH